MQKTKKTRGIDFADKDCAKVSADSSPDAAPWLSAVSCTKAPLRKGDRPAPARIEAPLFPERDPSHEGLWWENTCDASKHDG